MIQINAATRLSNTHAVAAASAHKVLAATAADAGKIVLWIEKATGTKGVAKGKAGKLETVTFKVKAGKDIVTLSIQLDVVNGGMLQLDGFSKQLGDLGSSQEKTGRKTILNFKNELRGIVNYAAYAETAAETIAVLKKLLSAKSKVEA